MFNQLDYAGREMNEELQSQTRFERPKTVVGTFVFIFVLEALFMGATMFTTIILPMGLLAILYPYGIFSMTYVLFFAIASLVMLGWKRAVKNEDIRIWSLTMITGIISMAIPVLPFGWNLSEFLFHLGIEMNTWPIIFGAGFFLSLFSLLELKKQQEIFPGIYLALASVVFIAYMDIFPTLLSYTPPPTIILTMSPFWIIPQMGAIALILEILIKWLK